MVSPRYTIDSSLAVLATGMSYACCLVCGTHILKIYTRQTADYWDALPATNQLLDNDGSNDGDDADCWIIDGDPGVLAVTLLLGIP